MKKFFTLIAAVAMAASVNAQATYSFEGLTKEDLTFEAKAFEWNAKTDGQLDYITNSKTDYSTVALKDSPVSLLYKNSKTKTKVFTLSDKYFCAQAKGTLVSVSGLGAGQEVTFTVASKGGTAAVFEVFSGCTAVDIPKLEAKSGEDLTFVDVKVKATEDVVTIRETDGGFGIQKVVVAGTPTGISTISSVASAKSTATYNLAGQQVSDSYKGIVIQNGKKFLKK